MIRDVRRATSAAPALVDRAPRTQAQRRDEAERRILEAAADIVAESGLDALTLTNAGERAGYSRGLPAHYFRNKTELVSALVTHIIDLFMESRRENAGDQSSLEGLLTTVEVYLHVPRKRPSRVWAFHAVLAAALHTPAIATTVAELNRRSAAEIAASIRAGIKSREIRADVDPDVEGVLILAGLRGVVAQWLADPEGIDLEQLSRGFVASLKRRLMK